MPQHGHHVPVGRRRPVPAAVSRSGSMEVHLHGNLRDDPVDVDIHMRGAGLRRRLHPERGLRGALVRLR